MAAPVNKRFSLLRGRVMRVTALDGCGAIEDGQFVTVVSKGVIQVQLTAQTQDGTAISQTNMAGEVCISDTPPTRFTGYQAQIDFCEVDPATYTILTGQEAIRSPQTGDLVGFTIDSSINPADSGFALELWSNVPGVACDPDNPDAAGNFGYILLPFFQGGIIGDFTIQNDAITFTVQGANTKTGSGWGVGPYDVVEDVTGDAAPLSKAIGTSQHLWLQYTTIAPPAVTAGAVSHGVTPTTAAATTGLFGPTGAWTPETFKDLVFLAPTATPNTAWTTGQHVTLKDGTTAHWSGTAWVVGTL